MTKTLQWVEFARRMLPELVSLGRVLYERHHGDITAARRELGSIRAHWAELDEERLDVDRELEELERRRTP